MHHIARLRAALYSPKAVYSGSVSLHRRQCLSTPVTDSQFLFAIYSVYLDPLIPIRPRRRYILVFLGVL